jgi:arabinose-5-phosphate isomerase
MSNNEVLAAARHRIRTEARAVTDVADALDDTFVAVAAVLLDMPGKLFIGGSGTSGTVARRMAHVLSVSGTPAIAFSPMDSLHGASGAITSDDVVLLISKGGASDEVVSAARIARGRGAVVIALTRAHDTLLAREADHSVAVDVRSEAELGGVIATGITMAQAAWGDALAEVLMRGRGYTWAQFMTTHPAGAVGKRDDLPPELSRLSIPGSRTERGAGR